MERSMIDYFKQKLNLKFLICLNAIAIIGFLNETSVIAQNTSQVFEARYFTDDSKANGETDFKGETDWMNTDDRVAFLNKYADFASEFFNNPKLDKEIVTDEEIYSLLKSIKPQPGNKIRESVNLNDWKAYGYKDGQDQLKAANLAEWTKFKGVGIVKGELHISNTQIEKKTEPLTWRFKLECNLRLAENSEAAIELKNDGKSVISLIVNSKTNQENNSDVTGGVYLNAGEDATLVIEGDFTRKRYNFYLNNKLVKDFSLMADTSVAAISSIAVKASGDLFLDDVFLFNHTPLESRSEERRVGKECI